MIYICDHVCECLHIQKYVYIIYIYLFVCVTYFGYRFLQRVFDPVPLMREILHQLIQRISGFHLSQQVEDFSHQQSPVIITDRGVTSGRRGHLPTS